MPISTAIRNSSECGPSSTPARPQVSSLGGLPKAVAEVRYLDHHAIDDECRHFKAVLDQNPGAFVEPFMSAPSPGILAMAVRNEHYDTLEAYLAALGAALKVEYEAIVKHGFLLQVDAPDLALERHITYKDRPLAAFVGFVEQVVATINTALANVPRERVRLHVLGQLESPHDSDVPLEDILPALQQAKVGGFVLPFANPRHAHEFRCFERHPLAHDQILVAGVIDSLTNFVEHPEVVADRIERVAAVVGDPRASSPAPIAASTRPPAGGASPRMSCGPSSRACATAPASHRNGCSDRREEPLRSTIYGAVNRRRRAAGRRSPAACARRQRA